MSTDKSISQLYNQGDFIDAKDNQGDWRVGFIIQKHMPAQLFKVRFDGWSCKYDQVYKFTSPKLQHFRTYVIGYTGQMKNPGLRESWNFTLQNLQQRTNQLQNFISNPLQYNVFQINQFIRGQNYIFSDFLMTNKYQDIAAFSKVIQYFWLNIEFLTNFLIRINENFAEFLKAIQNRKEPQQNNPLQAYYLSFYEVFDTLFIIFGNYERLDGFFKNNEEHLRQYFKVPPNKDNKRFFKQQLVKHLSNMKGINLIDQILQKLKKVQQFVPFLFLSALGHLIVGIGSICAVPFRQGLLQKLFKIGEENVKRIKQSQIKELHRKEVSTFIEALTTFSAGTKYEDGIEEWAIYLELSLSLKMILCPYFQRKLKGISHISEVCEKHQNFINKDNKFRLWIDQNNLFKNLFILNDNPEIIKKSCELTRFLVIRKMLKHSDVDTIWNSRIGKHQTVLKEIYTLISQLPYYQKDYSQNVKLFNKIANVPPEQWDDQYIHMIRVFSTYSYSENTKENPKEILGFDIVSQYTIRKGSDTAISELGTLFLYIQDSPYLTKFQEECLLQIQNQVNPKRYIRILYKLAHDDVQSFNKLKIDGITLLQTFIVQNANNQDASMIEQALKLIQIIVKANASFIEASVLTNLWSNLVDSSNRKVFLNWIYLSEQKYVGLSPIFKKSRLAELFLKVLWNTQEKKRTMDELQVSIVIEFIKQANFEIQKTKFGSISGNLLPNEIHGHQLLMSTLKLVEDQKAALKICQFLAYLYVNVSETLVQKAITSLSQTILNGINESIMNKNSIFLTRLLTLMKKTLDYDDQLFPSKMNPKHHYSKEFIVTRRDIEQQITIKFNYLGYFYEFKKIVAMKTNLPIHKFYLVNSKGFKLGRQHFNKTMVDQSFTGGKFQLFLKEESSIIKAIFNSNIDTLFNLLDDPSIQILLWSIVERLPLSEELKVKISRSQNIFEELQHIGFYKQLYMLKVMQELSSEEWMKFAKAQKINSLIKYLKRITFANQIEEEYVIAVTNSLMKMVVTIRLAPDLSLPQQLLPTLISVLAALFQNIYNFSPKILQLQQKIIKNIFQIANLLSKTQNVLERLMNHEKIIFILNAALIYIPQHQIRNRFVQEFKILIKNFDFEKDQKLISLLLGNLFSSAINFKNKENLKEYYTLTSYVLSKCSITVIDFVYKKEINGLVLKIFELLKKQRAEQSNECQNKALQGYLILLKHLIKAQKEQHQAQILNYIVYECLFSQNDSKCKSSPSRKESFNVLLQLSQNQKNLTSILDYLISLHKKGKWRSRRFEDWGITFNDKMKSSTGYVGIKNLGCICYMNSFIQQLFMTPYFRYSITNAVDKSPSPPKPEQNVLYQLQKMFMNLEYSDKKFYNPKQFCHAFKDYEGNPTNVTQQMDIDQFSNILFDRLQHQLKQTQYSTLIKDMFGGVFSNQIVCKGCPHYSESQQPFLSISLTVKSKKTIYQGFQSMIKGDNLDGDNAYYCERCNKKVNAVKRMSLKKMPNHLIITLKRFQFDYEKMIKLKVNDFCEFPHSLNLREYSQQFLRKQEASKTIQEQDQLDNEYFNYVLKGFVIHLGHADSGHYYSIIQDRATGKWFEFNDSTVRDFDIEQMPEQAYGGEIGMTDLRQKIKNAYMVIYERQKKIPAGNQIYQKKQTIMQKPENSEIISEIKRENKEHKLQNILFSKQYMRYLISLLGRSQKLDYKVQKSILKFATIYYLTVTVREKAEGVNEFIMKRISRNMQKHPDLALWIVNLFSIDKIYDQFFQHNPYKEMKKMLSHWLVYLAGLCQPEAKKDFLHSCLNKVVSKGQNPYQICIILYQMLNNDIQLLKYAISTNIVGKIMENIVRQKKDKKLLPESQKESQIGYQTPVPMGLAQQIRQKKLRSLQNENQFVWAIINLVIRYAVENKKELKEIIEQSEWQSLFMPQLKIYKIIQELKNKFAIYEFTHLMAYLTKNNQSFLQIIVDQIFTGLRDFQSKRYRQFMILFEQIINIRDDLEDPQENEKLKAIRLGCFEKIIQALKHNEQYSLDSNIIQQWLVILLNRNQNLRSYLQKQPETLNYLLLLSTKKVPSDQISRKNKKFTQPMVNKYHGVVFLCSKKGYLKQSEQIKEFYQSIAQDKFVQSTLWPTSPENHLKKIAINDKVAYFDQSDKCQYEEVFVSNIFLGKVELSEGKSKIYNIWKDDERLMSEIPPIHQNQQQSLQSSEKLTEELSEEEGQIIDD